MYRRWLMMVVALCVLTASPSLFAQSQRVSVQEQQVSTYADEVQSSLNVPSLAVGVLGPDETAHLDVRGEGSTDEPFLIGSLSKSVTAVAVLLLEDDGTLSLDDSAAEFVDEVPEEVTLAHLLEHKSGLDRSAGVDAWTNRDQSVEQAAGKASWKEPGGEFSYSNLNYEILGAVVEKVSGQSFGEFAAERIFEPLGMEDASAHPEPPSEHIVGHQYIFGFPVALGEPDYNPAAVPSGFVWMSAEDMEAWLRAFLNEGRVDGAQALPADVMAAFDEEADEGEYEFGWLVGRQSGSTSLSHTGLTGAFSASATIVPARQIAVFSLANVNSWEGGVPSDVVNSIIGAALRGEEQSHSNLEFLVRLGFGLLCLFVLFLFLKELVQWLAGGRPTGLDKKAARGVIVDVAVASLVIVATVFLFGASVEAMIAMTPDLAGGFLLLVFLLPLRRLLRGFNATAERRIHADTDMRQPTGSD